MHRTLTEAANLRSLRQSEGWYPGLDGVRGIAVFLVFTLHYVPRLTGYMGWVGVDIFFVLSGFLITGVLYDNRNEPHRFRNFYVRRTLRIFPLFYFIWICIFLTAFVFRERWRPLLALWPLYLGNYARFIAGTEAVDRVWTSRFAFEIGHFWSLGVEEQFYLLWPLVVFRVESRRVLIRICIAVMLIVLLLRIALTLTLPSPILELGFLYRMTFSQADAFLFGGLLALMMRGPLEPFVVGFGKKLLTGATAALLLAWLCNAGMHLRPVYSVTPWMSSYGFTLVNFAAGGLILSALRPGEGLYLVLSWNPRASEECPVPGSSANIAPATSPALGMTTRTPMARRRAASSTWRGLSSSMTRISATGLPSAAATA